MNMKTLTKLFSSLPLAALLLVSSASAQTTEKKSPTIAGTRASNFQLHTSMAILKTTRAR
jgi:hypothetical protein